MTYTITIPGEPTGKARPRVTRSGIAFTPAKSKNYETLVQELFFAAHGSPMLSGQVCATIKAFYGLNKSDYGKKGITANGARKLNGVTRPTKKPDADNIAKIILDSLNGIAYTDDSQVVNLKIEKHYSEKPRVEIEITELGGYDHETDNRQISLS